MRWEYEIIGIYACIFLEEPITDIDEFSPMPGDMPIS